MEMQEALDIVRKPANDVHPEIGELVTSDSVYQHPQAVRALHCAIVALEFQHERERTRRFLPANADKTWSDREDAQICEELRHGINFVAIARAHTAPRRSLQHNRKRNLGHRHPQHSVRADGHSLSLQTDCDMFKLHSTGGGACCQRKTWPGEHFIREYGR